MCESLIRARSQARREGIRSFKYHEKQRHSDHRHRERERERERAVCVMVRTGNVAQAAEQS